MYNYSLKAEQQKRRHHDKEKLRALINKSDRELTIKQMIFFAEENALTLPTVEELYNQIKAEQKNLEH